MTTPPRLVVSKRKETGVLRRRGGVCARTDRRIGHPAVAGRTRTGPHSSAAQRSLRHSQGFQVVAALLV